MGVVSSVDAQAAWLQKSKNSLLFYKKIEELNKNYKVSSKDL